MIKREDVWKAHKEEHLTIVNKIKELQYAIAKTQTIVGKMVESDEAEPTETSTLGEKHQLSHGRLIDADELKKHLDGAWEELNDDGERKGVRLARWYLISAPTVDSTIDVVRCKDCRHRDLFSCPLAENDFQKDDDFCSWGERKEPLPQYEEWQDEFNKMCESARPKTFVADEWYRDTFGENDGK